MALQTRAKFYFGAEIPSTSIYIAFQELTGPVRVATLTPASYGISGFVAEIQRALRAAGTQNYVVSVNRSTRLVTISAPANFSVFIATGPYIGALIYSTMGFPLADLTGANSYTASSALGKEYVPRFFLLDFVDTENFQTSVDATVNETGSGDVEVIRYGTKKFMRCNIDFVTNECLSTDSWIENDPTAVEKLQEFMQNITQKRKIEFMKDRDKPEEFQTFILESTRQDSKGLGYELTEKSGYDGYFTTGAMVFRLQE